MSSLSKSLYTSYLKSLETLQAEPEHSFDFERSLGGHPVLKTFLESSPSISFMLDYRTGKYYYFSQNAQHIVGLKQQAFYAEGVGLAMHLHMKEDAQIYYNSIFEKRLKFIRSLKREERCLYSFKHNFRILSPAGRTVSLLQEYRVLKADAKGNPLVIMGFCTDISHIKADTRITDVIISRKPGALPTAVAVNYYYPRPEEGALTAKELEILKLILEGYSSKDIADRMHISIHTVCTHRKHMHDKTNARNTADLLRYALDNGLM